ncbi:YhjD/YihY/BrkB family envelope integrity protein [Streptomyces sp. NPDC048604]|uniref:YhjD/YihY/BrkB family envelope integrity protein n=1 Tax=Streptomyces sp. NPDC048604 TaxID=3365578 RepID=UPI0037100D34
MNSSSKGSKSNQIDQPAQSSGHARRAAEWGRGKYTGSWADSLWRRLGAVDFISQAMVLAATLLLCAVPFFLIVTALAGASAAATLSHRMGLSEQAAADVGELFASSSAISGAVTGTAWVFFVLAGLAGAKAVQQLYQRVFDVSARAVPDTVRALVWLALVVGALFAVSAAGSGVRESQPALFWIMHLVLSTGFFWLSMWFLLGGGITWRRLLPCAVATSVCWVGMIAVFSAIFSDLIVSYNQRYGAIGTVFALMSFFIAIGVVLVLGAALGLVWTEHGLSFRAAVGKLRRRP